MAVKIAQDRATTEREMTKMKLISAKKVIEDNKRIFAAEKKMESKKFDEMALKVKLQTELEKRKKAEDEKRRLDIW